MNQTCPCCQRPVSVCMAGYDPNAMMEAAANAFGMTVEEMKRKTRRPQNVDARHVAMALLRECSVPTLSHAGIAALLETDHTSSQYGCRRMGRMPADLRPKRVLTALVETFRNSNSDQL